VLSAELIGRLRSCQEAELGRGATPQEIELAEKRLGVEFPESYKAFLGHFGWASLEGLELYGLGEDVPTYLGLVKVTLSERTHMRSRLPNRLVPLMNDGAGNHYCLDVMSRQKRRMSGSLLGSQLGGVSRPGVRSTELRGMAVGGARYAISVVVNVLPRIPFLGTPVRDLYASN